MLLEYTFKSSCYPIGERKICEIDPVEALFTSSAYNIILNTLSNDGVFTNDILSLRYRLSKWDKWKKVEHAPLISTASNNSNRIFVKVQLKPCAGQLQERLNKRIEELKEENLNLRQQFESLLSSVRYLQKQMDELKQSQQTPRFDKSSSNFQTSLATNSFGDSFQKDIDIAYLYAIPLVRKGTRLRRNEPIRDPIDIHKEISALEKTFTSSKKELHVTINSGNIANLMHILSQRPRIVHISCHGAYECEQGEAKPYLYLEDAKQPGMMEKFNEETIKEIFTVDKSSRDKVRPRVVFISACHSQRFGEIIKEAGIPNVIAVNGNTQVADEAAIGFASSFYYFLLKGKTVKEAFDCAKAEERYSNMSINLCCCAHRHEKDCLWSAKKEENHYEAHAMHVPSCDCKFGGNLHKPECRWLKEIPSDLFEVTVKNSSNLKRVCCCSSEIPHEEEEKFILMSQSMEAANEKVFDDIQTGEATIIKSFIGELVPKPHEVLIGRNVEVQQLVELLSCDPNKKIICVTGPPKVGKKLLIRTAAKYVMECVDTARYDHENFPDGFVSIKLTNTLWLLSKLNGALLPPPNVEARSLEELPKKIRDQRKIVVLDCENVMKSNAIELIDKLRDILKEGVRIKFILISKKRVPELDVDGELIVRDELDMLSAYSIIKTKIPEWKSSYIKFTKTRLAQEMRTPWLIKKAAILLKDYSEDEVYERLLREETPCRKTEKHGSSLENALKIIEEKCETIFPIFLLAQMQAGLFGYILEELAKGSTSKLDVYIESEPLAVVSKSEVEELGEVRYKLFDDMATYINEVKLTATERALYQLLCLKVLAHTSRCLVRSYNFLRYKYMNYNEFSAIIGEGIWTPLKSSYKITSTLKDPSTRFQYEKDNLIALLDPNVLEEIVKETHPTQILDLLDNIKELTICSFTLLHCFRPTEAMNIVDAVKGFVNRKNCSLYDGSSPLGSKYTELEATMALIKGSIALNHAGCLEMAEGMEDAERAEDLFNDIKNYAGIGEAQFLQGLFLEQRSKRYDEIESAYNSALMSFGKVGCKLGEARVSLAKAVLMLNSMRMDGVLDLLNKTINILKDHEYFNNMLGISRYRRGRYYLMMKNYELAKEDLESALENFGQWNNLAVDKCNVSLRELALLKENDCPVFTFLKAMPLVMKDNERLIPLSPNVRNYKFSKNIFTDCFSQVNKSLKTYLSTLTLENLKYAIAHNSTILHIASNHYEDGYLSMESDLGHLNKISLEELYNEFNGKSGFKKCKVVVVSIPKAKDIAQMFVDLGVPHVIYFSFLTESLYQQPENIEDLVSKTEYMFKFSVNFYKGLARGFTVYEAWKEAKKMVINLIETMCKARRVKYFHCDDDADPILLPPGNHDEQVLCNLCNGSFIDISPKRAQCDIGVDRRSFVGRQVEMYSIARMLCEGQCVNLYGKSGVGKTKLAKELGFFLFIRILFNSYICYFDLQSKCKTLKAELDVKLQYSQSSGLPILIIVDNMRREYWRKERNYFRTLRNDRNCVFLFITERFLELDDNQFFPMLNYELKAFTDIELSLDLVFTLIQDIKGFTISDLVLIELRSCKDYREAIKNLKGFKQANGYPRLLAILGEKMIETNFTSDELKAIDLWKDKTIDPKYKKVIKHKFKNTNFSQLSALLSLNEGKGKRPSSHLPQRNRRNSKNIVDTSRPFILMGPVNTVKESKVEEGNSGAFKNLLKLDKTRDISPIDDNSCESSDSEDECLLNIEENNEAFSMILTCGIKEHKEELIFNAKQYNKGKVKRTNKSSRKKKKGNRREEAKKTFGKTKKPTRKHTPKFNDDIPAINIGNTLNSVESYSP